MARRRRGGRRGGGYLNGTLDRFAPRSPAIETKGGIRAESVGGDFGSTWWAKRWQAVLESFRLGGRLERGRTYARKGQVLSIDVVRGKVTASVQGSRVEPYDVEIGVTLLSAGQWDSVLKAISGQAKFVAKLLAGEMPQEIEEVFTSAELSLFPGKRGDLHTRCSCPDEANPCKHIAAVYYLLGEEFDRDPFLILRMRGLQREELLARLSRSAPNAVAEEPVREPLTREPAAFWALPPGAEEYGEVQAPPVTAGVVRRLGKFPFWRGERPLAEVLEPAYVQASALGLTTFLGEQKSE